MMGRESHSELAQNVWKIVREVIPDANRQRIAQDIIKCFENYGHGPWARLPSPWADQLYTDAKEMPIPKYTWYYCPNCKCDAYFFDGDICMSCGKLLHTEEYPKHTEEEYYLR